MNKLNSYNLSRTWFNFCFENPEKIKPNHTALYFFCIEHCNRLGWKEKFGLPTTMAKEAIGMRSYNTYINTLNDLVEFGFIILIEKSKNQYSSNIIALSNFNKAQTKALDKALIKHATKQSESTGESIDSINKQETKNKKQKTSNSETFNLLKQIFTDSYFSLTENEYYFIPKDGAKIKSIEKKLLHAYKSKGNNNPSKDEMKNGFKHILKLAKSDKWIKENYSLSIIDSKFNEIISKKNEKQTTSDRISEAFRQVDELCK